MCPPFLLAVIFLDGLRRIVGHDEGHVRGTVKGGATHKKLSMVPSIADDQLTPNTPYSRGSMVYSTSDMVNTEPSRLHRGGGGRGCIRALGLVCFVPTVFLLCAGLLHSDGALVCFVYVLYDREWRRKTKQAMEWLVRAIDSWIGIHFRGGSSTSR